MTQGPSPRARGSRDPPEAQDRLARSIPASAGKPRWISSPVVVSGVHPRERGEARDYIDRRVDIPGPSPRARGSPRPAAAGARIPGSIPASAGKPPSASRSGGGSSVHPRERGEAADSAPGPTVIGGPSPRARGSHGGGARRPHDVGSIPASAGKPTGGGGGTTPAWVHPRERGEATAEEEYGWLGQGPSPRARGSPDARGGGAGACGSIPASAGKPRRC